jgi:hypothetical protein
MATFRGGLDFSNSLVRAIAEYMIQQVDRQLRVQTTADRGLYNCRLDVHLLPYDRLSMRRVLVYWLYCNIVASSKWGRLLHRVRYCHIALCWLWQCKLVIWQFDYMGTVGAQRQLAFLRRRLVGVEAIS